MSSTELAQVDADLKALTRLAHGSEADVKQYEQSQPRALALAERKAALEAAGHKASHTAVAATHSASAAPSSWMEYSRLPQSDQFDQVDAKAWELALPEMAQMGLTTTQVAGLARLLEKSSREAQRLRVQARDEFQGRVDSYMAGQYGSGWHTKRDNTNRRIQAARKHHRDVRVGDLILADGTRLGDNPYYVSQMIDVVENL